MTQLTPASARSEEPLENGDAPLRDQLFTELVRRYDELYEAGVEIWGRRRVAEYVPPLWSRVPNPRETSTPLAPTTNDGAA